jgi:hypothetical protein
MGNIFGNNNSMIWILLLLCFCGNGFGDSGCGDRGGCGIGNDMLLPILLLCLCGGGFGKGFGCDN